MSTEAYIDVDSDENHYLGKSWVTATRTGRTRVSVDGEGTKTKLIEVKYVIEERIISFFFGAYLHRIPETVTLHLVREHHIREVRDVSSIVCSYEHSHRPYNDVLHRREK